MPSPTFRDAASNNGTGATVSATEPTGAASGDIMQAVAYTEATGPTFVTPSGWSSTFGPTAVTIESIAMTNPHSWKAHAYWIRRGGSAPTLLFDFTTSGFCQVHIIAYSGAVSSGDPWSFAVDVDRDSGVSNTPYPDISGTTDTADEMLIFAGINWVGVSASTAPTSPGSWTARDAVDDVFFAEKAQAAAGATGTVTGQTSNNSFSNASSFLFGLRSVAPAAGGHPSAKRFGGVKHAGYGRRGGVW